MLHLADGSKYYNVYVCVLYVSTSLAKITTINVFVLIPAGGHAIDFPGCKHTHRDLMKYLHDVKRVRGMRRGI